jgi:hypothetical protein
LYEYNGHLSHVQKGAQRGGEDLLAEEEIVGLAVVETAGRRCDAKHLPPVVQKGRNRFVLVKSSQKVVEGLKLSKVVKKRSNSQSRGIPSISTQNAAYLQLDDLDKTLRPNKKIRLG